MPAGVALKTPTIGRTGAAPRNVVISSSPVDSALAGVGRFSSSLSSLAFIGPMIGAAIGFFADKKPFAKAAPSMQKAVNIAQLPNATVAEFSDAFAAAVGESKVAQTASQFVKNSSITLTEFANQRLGPKVTNTLAQNTVANTIISGTMVVGEMVNTTLTLTQRIQALRQMQFDLTGTMPSASEARWSNNLHPIVKAARQEVSGAKAGLATFLQVGGTIANSILLLSGRGNGGWGMIGSLVLGMGTNAAAGAITAGNTALSSYSKLHNEFAQSGAASLETYKGLITGFIGRDADENRVYMFARQCCEAKLRPAEVLERVQVFKQQMAALQLQGNAGANQENTKFNSGAPQNARPPITIGNKLIVSKVDTHFNTPPARTYGRVG